MHPMSRVKLPLASNLESVFFPLIVKFRIGGGEADPRSVPRGNPGAVAAADWLNTRGVRCLELLTKQHDGNMMPSF
jgi:hypothetical protein